MPPLFKRSIMVHHRIHIARRHNEGQSGLTAGLYAGLIGPVRLRDEGYPVAGMFQQSGDDGCSERRMIHIGVPADVDKVGLIPAPSLHLFHIHRQEIFLPVYRPLSLLHIVFLIPSKMLPQHIFMTFFQEMDSHCPSPAEPALPGSGAGTGPAPVSHPKSAAPWRSSSDK